MRFFLLGTLGLILAQESCGVTDCKATGCPDAVLNRDNPQLAPDETWVFEEDCNTCGHTTVELKWEIPGGLTAPGSVVARLAASCGLVTTQGASAVVPAEVGRNNFEVTLDNNVRNVCGERKDVQWQVTLLNLTNMPLRNLKAIVSCPNYTGGSPTAP